MPPRPSASSSAAYACSTYCDTISTAVSGVALAQHERSAQALVAERRRQANVDDRDVGSLEQHRMHERVAVGHRRDDVEAVVAQQPRQAVAQQCEILGDHDAHGITALHRRRAARRARDLERAVERLDAPRQACEPGARHVGAARRRRPRPRRPGRRAAGARRCRRARRSRACRCSRAPPRRRSTRRSRPAPRGARRCRRSRARAAASGSRAPRSPLRGRGRRARAGGCRARDRAAPRAPRARRGARPRAARCAPAGSDANFCSASPRLMPSATSRACAPSCRSRSIRRSSDSCWSTAPARVCSSTAMRSASPPPRIERITTAPTWAIERRRAARASATPARSTRAR